MVARTMQPRHTQHWRTIQPLPQHLAGHINHQVKWQNGRARMRPLGVSAHVSATTCPLLCLASIVAKHVVTRLLGWNPNTACTSLWFHTAVHNSFSPLLGWPDVALYIASGHSISSVETHSYMYVQ